MNLYHHLRKIEALRKSWRHRNANLLPYIGIPNNIFTAYHYNIPLNDSGTRRRTHDGHV